VVSQAILIARCVPDLHKTALQAEHLNIRIAGGGRVEDAGDFGAGHAGQWYFINLL